MLPKRYGTLQTSGTTNWPQPSDPQSIQMPIKVLSRNGKRPFVLITNIIWECQNSSSAAVIVVPGAFNLSHPKYTGQTASQTKRFKTQAENCSRRLRLSSADSSLIASPGLPQTVEARPGGAGRLELIRAVLRFKSDTLCSPAAATDRL